MAFPPEKFNTLRLQVFKNYYFFAMLPIIAKPARK